MRLILVTKHWTKTCQIVQKRTFLCFVIFEWTWFLVSSHTHHTSRLCLHRPVHLVCSLLFSSWFPPTHLRSQHQGRLCLSPSSSEKASPLFAAYRRLPCTSFLKSYIAKADSHTINLCNFPIYFLLSTFSVVIQRPDITLSESRILY